jgi:hypothetical protein
VVTIQDKLANLKNIGKPVKLRVKGSSKKYLVGTIVDEVTLMCGEYKAAIQKIKAAEGIEATNGYLYRIWYYTPTAAGDRIAHAQYGLILDAPEFQELLRMLKKKCWFRF